LKKKNTKPFFAFFCDIDSNTFKIELMTASEVDEPPAVGILDIETKKKNP